MPELVTRIPVETLEKCDSWLLPEMTSDNVVKSVNSDKNNLRRKVAEKKKNEKINY